jgi:hypothetical protein
MRKKEFADKGVYNLDKREDASSPRLLSPTEEKIISGRRGEGVSVWFVCDVCKWSQTHPPFPSQKPHLLL